MAVTDKEVKDFESKYKKILFDKIHNFSFTYSQLISSIEESSKYTGTDSNLPNIVITLNNKLVELSHSFREAGTSIFSTKIEDYGIFNLNMVSSSLIGEAIIFDMFSRTEEATVTLQKYSSLLEQMSNIKRQQAQSLKNGGPLKSIFLKFRSLVFPSQKIDLSYTQEETEKLNSFLSQYKEIDEQLWKYNLENDLVSSLVKHIVVERNYSETQISGLLEESVIPDLQKLGLMHLLPQLQQELFKAYAEQSKSQNSWELAHIEKIAIQEDLLQIAERYSNPENSQTSVTPSTSTQEQTQ